MRFIKAAACLAGSACAFTIRFFEMLPIKSVVPFVVQMLVGWGLLFAGGYHLIRVVGELIANAKGGKS